MSDKTLSRDLILLHSTMWIQIQNLWLIWKKLLSISFKCSLLSHTIIQSTDLDENSCRCNGVTISIVKSQVNVQFFLFF